jgi:hypothetical protein
MGVLIGEVAGPIHAEPSSLTANELSHCNARELHRANSRAFTDHVSDTNDRNQSANP